MFLQAAVFGGETEKPEIDTEIWIAPVAPFTVVAGNCRIHSHTNTGEKDPSIAGARIRPGTLNHAGTFMTGHNRVLNNGVADPAIEIRVKVAPANARRRDPHDNLPGARTGRIGNCLKPQIV